MPHLAVLRLGLRLYIISQFVRFSSIIRHPSMDIPTNRGCENNLIKKILIITPVLNLIAHHSVYTLVKPFRLRGFCDRRKKPVPVARWLRLSRLIGRRQTSESRQTKEQV